MVKILFENNVAKESTKSYVQGSPGHFSSIFENDQLTIVVKEVTEENQSYETLRMIAGDIAYFLKKRAIESAAIHAASLIDAFSNLEDHQSITAFVEGWHLGAYEFDTYKSKKANPAPILDFTGEEKFAEQITMGEIRAAATGFSRDLMNETPSTLNPETFPTALQKEFRDTGVEVIVHNKATLVEMEMNGILTVNRGSKYDPAFIELHYEGDPTKPLVALVGKGVTFDTGGISLKKGRNISNMRMDMGGAAAVAGAIKLLAESKAPVNVVGLIQTVENMPGKDALLPGEIITYKNGHTVQIGNTDAEGRLILADGLIRAGELNAAYIVDIATLTGSIAASLGPKLAGVFGEEELLMKIKAIGHENGDFVWPMPLVEDYDQTLKSDYADFSNISNQAEGGSITAALFLRRFVPRNSKWVHVDMAGVMEGKRNGYYSGAATGFGARLLADYTVQITS